MGMKQSVTKKRKRKDEFRQSHMHGKTTLCRKNNGLLTTASQLTYHYALAWTSPSANLSSAFVITRLRHSKCVIKLRLKSQPYFEFVTTRSCELYDIFCLVVVNRPCFCITLCCCLYANECCRLSRKYVRVCLSDWLSVCDNFMRFECRLFTRLLARELCKWAVTCLGVVLTKFTAIGNNNWTLQARCRHRI